MTDFNTFLAKAVKNVPSIQESFAGVTMPERMLKSGEHFRLKGKCFEGRGWFGVSHSRPYLFQGAALHVIFSSLPPPGRNGFRPLLEALSEIFSGETHDFDASSGAIDIRNITSFYRESKCFLVLEAKEYTAWNFGGFYRKDLMDSDGWSRDDLYGMRFRIESFIGGSRLIGPVEALGPLIKKFIVMPGEE